MKKFRSIFMHDCMSPKNLPIFLITTVINFGILITHKKYY